MNYCAVGTTGELKLLPLRPHQPRITFTRSLPPQTPSILMFGITVFANTKAHQAPKKTKGVCGESHTYVSMFMTVNISPVY